MMQIYFKTLSVLLAVLAAGLFAGCQRRVATAAVVDPDEVTLIRDGLGTNAAAPATTAVAAAEPTGFGTIRGTFKLSGAAPARSPVSVTKDPNICMPGGKQPLSEEIVVDGTGGIKDVVIFCTTKFPADNAKWEHPDYAAAKTATRRNDMVTSDMERWSLSG